MKSNNHLTLIFSFIVFSLIIVLPNVYATPNVTPSQRSITSNEPLGLGSYVLIAIAVVVLGFFSIGIVWASHEANREYYLNQESKKELIQLEQEAKKINTILNGWNNILEMECMMCKSKIDRPMNLIKHLGIEQTKKYLQFCEDTNIKPTLYCCQCYPLVNRNPDWQRAFDETIDNQIKTHEMRKLWEMKIQA